jgi:anoctamin-10
MAFINNIFELRGDAFKISVHHRRPLPVRTDTIGPWLNALTFLTWLSAITNTALVYLFSPALSPVSFNTLVNDTNNATFTASNSDPLLSTEEHLIAASGGTKNPDAWGIDGMSTQDNYEATKELLLKAALVALVASHVYLLARMFIRHVVGKIWWKGSNEVVEREREETELKEKFLSGVGVGVEEVAAVGSHPGDGKDRGVTSADSTGSKAKGFWDHDEGVEEIQRIVKEA